jgi:two-component system, OmpR family, KDP operon response regulator KdpE
VLEKILLVDDDPAQLRMMTSFLNANSLKPFQAGSGREALRIITSDKPDLVILDVVMPDLDGCETCRLIRELSDVPVIIMTGQRKMEADIVRGLECGADEYVYKPLGNRELLARIKAALRRSEKFAVNNIAKKVFFSDNYLTVDVSERKVLVNGNRLKLTPREFSLLALLVENPDRILTHKQVLEQIWGYEYVNDIDYVRIYVLHLRHKIEPEPSVPRYILTEPGVGYYFCSAVQVNV